MQVEKLRNVGNSTIVMLPASVVEALHLHENDEVASDRRCSLVPALIFKMHGIPIKKLSHVIAMPIVSCQSRLDDSFFT